VKIKRRIAGLGLALSLICVYFFGGGEIGFSVEQHDQKTVVAAGTHPILLVWAALGIWFFYALLHWDSNAESIGVPSLARRFLSFMIDFYFSVIILGSIEALVPLFFEARRTGRFVWHFTREYSVRSDGTYGTLLVFLGMGLLVFYFAWPMIRGKQTVGCYMMRTVLVSHDAERRVFGWSRAVTRLFYETTGLCFWPYTLWKGLDRSGRTWYDRASQCDVKLIA